MLCPHCQKETDPDLYVNLETLDGRVLAHGEIQTGVTHVMDSRDDGRRPRIGGKHVVTIPESSILRTILGPEVVIAATLYGKKPT